MKEQLNHKAEVLLSDFNACKTLSSLQPIRNIGLEFKELKDNQWQRLVELDFDKYHDAILLYDNDFKVNAIGFFKRP